MRSGNRVGQRIALAAALVAGCADAGGNESASASEELTLGESLVARGQEFELDTVRVPPPGDFIEHEAAGFAKVLCSAVFLTGLDFEDAQSQIGGFTSRHQYRDRLPGRRLDRENRRVHVHHGHRSDPNRGAARRPGLRRPAPGRGRPLLRDGSGDERTR